MEERYLSLSEAADALDISERTAYRWIDSGKLRAYKPGRDYRIPESAIKEAVEESEVRPKAPPRSREEAAFIIVGQKATDPRGDERLRMVVKWNVPPAKRDPYRKSLHELLGADYLEEEMSPQAAELLATASG